VPEPPNEHIDLVYLCFPNNPTGAVASREQLSRWVDYAREHEALILFDAAYEAYIREDPHLNPLPGQGEADAKRQVRVESKIPHSIFEILGARDCAVELRSFSKNGGFTGVRCGFTVMPKSVLARIPQSRDRFPLHSLWQRRWSTKSNGVSYPVQRAAEALYSPEGRTEIRTLIDHYMGNAKLLRDAAADAGLEAFGGVNAPYVWVKTLDGLTSWEMFDRMLRQLHVVITPGAGFGAQGEGYFRISAFNSRENAEEVARRLKTLQ
jgi:LL-diaminopimelate aminotransferase